jgi:hypothetical protein
MTTANANVTASAPKFRINQQDRWSLIATIAITAIALLAGLLLRNTVESRTKTYKSPAGVTVQYPDAWRLNASEDVLRARDAAAQSFPTTLELRTVPVDPGAKDENALALAASQVALNRGRDYASFKVFDVNTGQTYKGLPGATSSFVFVSETGGVLEEGLPAVVLGDDILVRKGGSVYVFSALSTQDNHAQAMNQLKAFVDSAQLP